MELGVGNVVWINCEVKPGPFTDERRIRCRSPYGEWIGFVPVSALAEPITEGETKIAAVVINVANGKFSAKIPGEGIARTLYEDVVSSQIFDTIAA